MRLETVVRPEQLPANQQRPPEADEPEEQEQEQEEELFGCPSCERAFKTERGLDMHFASQHSDEDEDIDSDEDDVVTVSVRPIEDDS